MTALLYVDPAWMGADVPEVSNTWRWFHLEQWTSSSLPAGKRAIRVPRIAAHLPNGYAAILKTAAWMVTEALWRDGSSRETLSAEDMRWARRLGLALVGDTLPEGIPARSAALGQGRLRASLALERVSLVSLHFPETEQAILRLALPPVLSGSAGKGAPSIDQYIGIPGPKLELLVRLAKRHAAANVGVDLRQVRAEGADVNLSPVLSANQGTSNALVESFRRDRSHEYIRDLPPVDDLLNARVDGNRQEPRLMEA